VRQPWHPSRVSARPRRPRVVHVINGLFTGGAETFLARLVGAANTSPFEHVVVPLLVGGPVTERVREAGALAAPLRVEGSWNLATAPVRMAARLAHLRPDLVQGWLLQGNLAATIGARLGRLRAPVLWNVRWTLYDVESERRSTRALLRLSGRLSHHPRHIIFNSQLAVAQHAAIGFPADRARVIPNGFDTAQLQPNPDARLAIRHELGIAADAPVMGMVARYHEMKDHAMSLRAAARVAEARPEAVFVYAGRDVDADNERLTTLIAELGLGDRVHLLGERHDVARLYASFDVYWMSSVARGIAEGFPNVVAEAMSCGVPCVATDNGDAALIIGPTGRVVPSRDWQAFGDATLELLDAGPTSLARLGVEARSRIQRDYSLDTVTAAYDELYAEVLEGERARRSRASR
jgi:glycosyltransferase involved in cell wall biosynthesis